MRCRALLRLVPLDQGRKCPHRNRCLSGHRSTKQQPTKVLQEVGDPEVW